MSDTTGLKPISEEVAEKVAEAWFDRISSRLPLEKYEQLHDGVKRNMREDIRFIVSMVGELDEHN